MVKSLSAAVRKYPLLKLLVFSHAVVVAVLVAYSYKQAGDLWDSVLCVPVDSHAETGERLYQIIARGPSLLLPWNLLPQDVFWLAVDVLVVGTLAICLAYPIVRDELRGQLARREKAAADQLREAGEQSAAAERRMREAHTRELRLEGIESRLGVRASEVANREGSVQAHVEAKDAEMDKMSMALARLKRENRDLRKEVKQLRAGPDGGSRYRHPRPGETGR